ncbi:MAG: hypothetical protein OK422_06585 [Thaumarchaeota archaeon]|nr:hypothetical protein [Nitrososphaerota archaeon]
MYFEILTLEISATRLGWDVIKPALARGASGIDHRFSFLATDEGQSYAFDFYENVGSIEVLRSYAKKLDTSVSVSVVCLVGKPTEEAKRLAMQYRMRVMAPAELENLSLLKVLEVQHPRRVAYNQN